MKVTNQIKIIQGDITQLEADAIVNAANNSLMGGGGVDGAIHRAAGPALKEACRPFGGCPTGEARITPGFQLKAQYIIHTVGPVWNNDTQGESGLLRSAYLNSMELAFEHQIKSIAFPSISTGAYRFPFQKAAHIAVSTILSFIQGHEYPQIVILVAFGAKDFQLLRKTLHTFSRT